MKHLRTSPIHTDPKTDIPTIIQSMQQGFKKSMSTTATQYTQPILKTTPTQYTHLNFKTTDTQYTLSTSLNHSSTCTKSQHIPLNTAAVLYQLTTHHTLNHTYRPAPSDNQHSSIQKQLTFNSTPTYVPRYHPSTIPHTISTNS